MTDTSYKILNYLKEHNGVTAKEISEALDIEKRRVDSCFSAAIQGADLGVRDRSVSPATLTLNENGLRYKQ